MTLLRSTALLAAFTTCAASSLASTITFNISGAETTYSDGNSFHGTLTGTVAVDTVTGLVSSADLTFNVPGYGTPTFGTMISSSVSNGVTQAYISDPHSGSQISGGQIALFFNTAGIDTGNLALCTSASTCGNAGIEPSSVELYSVHGNLTYVLTGGTLSSGNAAPVALTPEPSSLALLGTGILGLAAASLVFPLRSPRLPEPPRLTDAG